MLAHHLDGEQCQSVTVRAPPPPPIVPLSLSLSLFISLPFSLSLSLSLSLHPYQSLSRLLLHPNLLADTLEDQLNPTFLLFAPL